jgi:hypothetical protein
MYLKRRKDNTLKEKLLGLKCAVDPDDFWLDPDPTFKSFAMGSFF